jgi:exodeoxyribonuclease V alpha subunit
MRGALWYNAIRRSKPLASDTLRGIIERITYHNEENGYTVAQLTPDGASYTVPVIGNMLGLNVGESVLLTGAWVAHAQYGRQFKADQVRTVLPATIAGLEKYLGSGLIKGIGPVTAKRIVRNFGLETLRIIEEEPARLHEVLGVGRMRVELITRAWAEQQQIKEVMLFLQSHNVSTGLAVKIYKQYGDDAIEIVKTDPYRLAREIYGIGFVTADKIARELGIAVDAPERVAAGVAYVLGQAADDGNVYLPATELAARSAELLGVNATLALDGIAALRESEQVWVEDGRAPGAALLAEERPVYLIPFYYGEIGVTNRLRRLIEAPGDRLAAFQAFNWPVAFAALAHQPASDAAAPRVALTPQQMQAVQAALTCRVTVLTGGPGTGKTTCTRSIIRLAEAAGARVVLASPTGRAAKRLSETTGRPAKTIHRLLEFKPAEGFAFQRNEENPLEADLVIVDEASMLDLLLTNHLLKAIPAGAHLLLVGDVDQLPSVGAGDVLHDVIEAIEGPGVRDQGSGIRNQVAEDMGKKAGGNLTPDSRLLSPDSCALIRLDTIFRQPEGSYIITNAHRINRGEMPLLDNRGATDFFLFREEDPAKAADLVVEIVAERIPRKFGLRPEQIQVLSPMHRAEVGVAALNIRLQEALNPLKPGLVERQMGGRPYRTGDRVMQIRNNYDKEVYNGDMGRILAVNLEDQTISVKMDERTVPYDFLEMDELVHAYAVSVHKAQGSEFPAVVIPLLTTHYMMLQRNLLYTAVTRAQKLVVLVGSPRAIGIAVGNNRAKERYSGLAERLRGA